MRHAFERERIPVPFSHRVVYLRQETQRGEPHT